MSGRNEATGRGKIVKGQNVRHMRQKEDREQGETEGIKSLREDECGCYFSAVFLHLVNLFVSLPSPSTV